MKFWQIWRVTVNLTFSDQTFSPTTGYWQSHYINNEEALKSEALIHMDEDDIFQVDKADLIQGNPVVYC